MQLQNKIASARNKVGLVSEVWKSSVRKDSSLITIISISSSWFSKARRINNCKAEGKRQPSGYAYLLATPLCLFITFVVGAVCTSHQPAKQVSWPPFLPSTGVFMRSSGKRPQTTHTVMGLSPKLRAHRKKTSWLLLCKSLEK